MFRRYVRIAGGGEALQVGVLHQSQAVAGQTGAQRVHDPLQPQGRAQVSDIPDRRHVWRPPQVRRAATWPLVMELKVFLSNNVRMSAATEMCTARSQ